MFNSVDASLQRVQQQFGIVEQRTPAPDLRRNRVPQPQSSPPPYHYTSPPAYLTTLRPPAYRSAAPTPELKPRVRISVDRPKTPEQNAPHTPATAQISLPDRSTPRTEHRSQTRAIREDHLVTPTRRRVPTASARARSRPPIFTLPRAEPPPRVPEVVHQDITNENAAATEEFAIDEATLTLLTRWSSDEEEAPGADQAEDADQERETLAQTAESNIFYYNQRFPQGSSQPKANCARQPVNKNLDMRYMFGRMDRKQVIPSRGQNTR